MVMAADLPLLVAHGHLLAAAIAAVLLVLGAAFGDRLARSLRAAARLRRQRSFATGEAMRARIRTGEQCVRRHDDEHAVDASSAYRTGGADHRTGSFTVFFHGRELTFEPPVMVIVGSREAKKRGTRVASTITSARVPGRLTATRVLSVEDGDEVLIKGELREGDPPTITAAEIAHTGPLRVEPTGLAQRIGWAVAALGVFALIDVGVGYATVGFAEDGSTIDGRWAAAQVAAATPFRERAIDAAIDVARLRIAEQLPDVMVESWVRREPAHIDERSLRQYLALSELHHECDESTSFLESIAIAHNAALDVAVEHALSCGKTLAVTKMAQARFWVADFEKASELYDRAALRWGEDDVEQVDPAIKDLTAGLALYNARQEAFVHALAGRAGAASRALERIDTTNEALQNHLWCTRQALDVIAGTVEATVAVAHESPVCAALLGPLVDRRARKATMDVIASDADTRIDYLAVWRGLRADVYASSDVTWRGAISGGKDPEDVYDLLVFPPGVEDTAPGLLLETLARLKTHKRPSRELRTLRARLCVRAATFEALAGDDEAARAWLVLAAEDVAAALEGDWDEDDAYQKWSLLQDRHYTAIARVAVELLAGEVEEARKRASAIVVPEREGDTGLASEVERMRASLAVTRAFVAAWEGKVEPLDTVTEDGGSCEKLSSCHVLLGDLQELRAAVAGTGDATSCSEYACLIRAQTHPEQRDAIRKALRARVGTIYVVYEPTNRLYRIGEALRLARALDDAEMVALLESWLPPVRERVVDPRWTAVLETLDSLQAFEK
jgi:hypothetical protein